MALVLWANVSLFGQEYKIVRGERPPIDLEKVSTDAFEPGKISIKLMPGMDKHLPDLLHQAGKNTTVITGIPALDKLNAEFKVEQYKPLLHGLYQASEKSNQHRERHKAWGFHLWFELQLDTKADIKEAVKKFAALPQVDIAEPVYKKALIGANENDFEPVSKPQASGSKWTPNDPRFNEQWHYLNTGQQNGTAGKDIKLTDAWEIEKGHTDVIVAIIDGGIQINHPDLQGNMWSGIGYNFVNNSSTIEPHNHGTHVAGTVAGINNNALGIAGVAGGSGLNDGVRLMSCQVFSASSQGGFATAPIYAADNGAAISQNSWGYTSPNVFEQSQLDAIDYFNQNGGGTVLDGGITIFAAGNSNSSGLYYPGCYSSALSVAATNNNDVKSWYSNFDTWVDISAPGGETNTVNERGVLSTLINNSYGFYQGTSMACPHVSGVAALLISNAHRNNLTLTNAHIWSLLVTNVDDHYPSNPTFVGKMGSGRLNALMALQALQAFYTTDPPATPTGLLAENIKFSSARLKWNQTPGALSYQILVKSLEGEWDTLTTNFTFITVTGLTEETTYQWMVRGINNNGEGEFAIGENFTTTEFFLTYCESSGNSVSDEWIAGVQINAFTNNSGAQGYTDFTNLSINLIAGATNNITLTPGFSSSTYQEYWRVWIDLNMDGEFTPDEAVFAPQNSSNTAISGTFSLADELPAMTTRMRISMKYGSTPDPCGTFSYGEVEDYTVVIEPSSTEPPLTPENLTASQITPNSFKLTWTVSAGASSYELQIREADGEWQSYTANTASYTANSLAPSTTYQAKVRAANNAGTSEYTDFIEITTLIAAPDAPSGLTVDQITATSALLAWQMATGAQSYEIRIRPVGGNWTLIETEQTNWQVEELTPETTYQWQVRASNTTGQSAYSTSSSFTTPPAGYPPMPPSNLIAANITNVKATLSWDPVNETLSYDIFVKADGSEEWTEYSSEEPLFELTGLTPSTEYTWKVRGTNTFGTGDFSDTQSFTTESGVGINMLSQDNVKLYPNPSNGLLYIECDCENQKIIRISNPEGQIVMEAKTFNNAFLLDINHLSNGIYFISIENNNQKVVRRLIKL